MYFQSILKGTVTLRCKGSLEPKFRQKAGWECGSAILEQIFSNAFFGYVPGKKWKRKNF